MKNALKTSILNVPVIKLPFTGLSYKVLCGSFLN